MDRLYKKTYGARKVMNKGQWVFNSVLNGSPTSLYYKRYDNAVKRAKELAIHCYKLKEGFKDIQGNRVLFVLEHLDSAF